jgi:acetoin utilization deacetylase AcuC-like enzyme
MLVVFSRVQRTHRPAFVIKSGKRSRSYDVTERVDSILSAIHEAALGPVIEPTHAGLDPIRAVHDAGMIEYLSTAYAREDAEGGAETPVFPSYFPPPGQRRRPRAFEGLKGFYCTNMGVPIDAHTWKAALASAHCAVTGARHLRSGERYAYALCRPPGHHAGPNFFGGYCYLNNAAIAAETLRQGGDRVAILDIDYHHGNGTQAHFFAERDVWYGSLHVDPDADYPFYAGYANETGVGLGEGTNWNVPLQPGASQGAYLSALEDLLARLVSFESHWLIVSAGFDIYIHDPVGTFQVSTAGFRKIGAHLGNIGLPTLVVQEGGYHVPHLGRNVVALLSGLVGL